MTINTPVDTPQTDFVHLHVHSEYSLLDGMSKVKDIVQKAKAEGMKAIALTDHGTCGGLVEFYNECKANGIRPILGCEVYEAPGSRFDKKSDQGRASHLILLVKNETGYKNLCHLVSRANTEGFYYKPRIDRELLKEFHEGLICLSACIAGRVPQDILSGDIEKAEKDMLFYKELFGNDYYVEIQRHGLPEEGIVNPALIDLARKNNIRLVATNDSHYVNKSDKEAHEWLLCMQTKKKITDSDRLQYIGDYSLLSGAEMAEKFKDVPEAVKTPAEIMNKCDFAFTFGQYRMPAVHIPKEYGNDYFRYLSDEAWKGFEKRYPEGHEKREEARERIKYELGIIEKMGFAEYFLDTRKTILWARENGVLVGPGRGSAAGSCMCYCLGITDLEPLRYDLLFERFLNPERVSMPDIDVDYEYTRKDDVIAFEAESNGKDHFAKIQTYQTMAAKEILLDTARVAGYPPAVGASLSKEILPNQTLKEAWELNSTLRDKIRSDPGLKKVWDIALRLENTKKSAGAHACGHVPTALPCEDLFPVSVDPKTGYLMCQYSMTQVEQLGNLKKDLLMLRNLTIISEAQRAVKKRLGEEKGYIPLWNEQILNDKEALDLIASGDTGGVFQLESEGMKGFMKRLKPSCFEDIIAGVALYRPGPMDFIDTYINGKHHPDEVKYLTPKLEPILKGTYGVIVYQEQVMQIVQALAGFSMGRADLLRKAMGKKKQEIMDAERVNFVYGNEELNIPGCIKNGIAEDTANKIYDQMIDFAKYAFNKSHAAAYAAISMQTAYLKAHHPLEFYAGLLSSVMDRQKKLAAYKAECDGKGIHVMPPDVNSSGIMFTATHDHILYGLTSIRNVGEGEARHILEERQMNGPYMSVCDFLRRNKSINSRAAEFLIKAGAVDELAEAQGLSRAAILAACPMVLGYFKKEEKESIPGQMTIFDMPGMENEKRDYEIPPMPELPKKEKYRMEKEATGFYITGHPLESYEQHIQAHKAVPIISLGGESEGEGEDAEDRAEKDFKERDVTIAGVINEKKVVYTKKDKRPMAILTVSDQEASIKAVVFPDMYEKCGHKLSEDQPVLIRGKAKMDSFGEVSVGASDITDLEKGGGVLLVEYNDLDAIQRDRAKARRRIDQNFQPGTGDIVLYAHKEKTGIMIHGCKVGDDCFKLAAKAFPGHRYVAKNDGVIIENTDNTSQEKKQDRLR